VLQAVRSQANYFKLSEPGTIRILDDGSAQFTPTPEGKHRYLTLDPAQQEPVLKTFIELASAKPVPRQPRRRPMPMPPPQQQQATPPKPPPGK
ncbi:MAG: hypothetical protein ACREBD_19560, partial [Blastocatellia bacterium]